MDKTITASASVADIVTRYPHIRALFDELSIDYCCGGKHSLEDACQKAGLPWQSVVERLNRAIEQGGPGRQSGKDWTAVPLVELVEHIITAHHTYLREHLPRLQNLARKVYSAHQRRHGETIRKLQQSLEHLRIDIEMHLAKEEQILFPLIREMEAYAAGRGPEPALHCGSIQNPIRQMELEHEAAGRILAEMRLAGSGYQLPQDACQSFASLYDGLRALEDDLHEHIHLENNILFPRAVELERKIRQ